MNFNQKVQLINGNLKITFRYSSRLVSQVKTLSGRKWHPAPKFWSCPPSFENFEKLIEWGFELDKAASTLWESMNETVEIDLSNHPALEGLYPFQLQMRLMIYIQGTGNRDQSIGKADNLIPVD